MKIVPGSRVKIDEEVLSLPNSVLNYYSELGIREIFDWQAACLNLPRILGIHDLLILTADGCGNLIYSAPTSAGKTLVAEVLVVKHVLENSTKVLIILPFVSVSREKMFHLQNLFSGLGVRVGGFMGGHSPVGGFSAVNVAVCTIEKANSLINRLIEDGRLAELGMVVVDELHLIGDSHRGYLLELLLTKLLVHTRRCLDCEVTSSTDAAEVETRSGSDQSSKGVQIVGMSATLPNLTTLAKWLDAAVYSTDFRPVPLTELIFSRDGKSSTNHVYLVAHSDSSFETAPKQQALEHLQPSDEPVLSPLVTKHSQGVLIDEDGVFTLCLDTLLSGHSVLVFCPTKQWCEQLADTMAKHLFQLTQSHFAQQDQVAHTEKSTDVAAEELDFAAQIASRIDRVALLSCLEQLRRCPAGLDPGLARCLGYSVAYHHAGLTMEEREIVENGFRKGSIHILVATSTLSSGVNLPARRVIIRTPLFHGHVLDYLSYKQMAGRAGRKGVDTVGQSILLCKPRDLARVRHLLGSGMPPVKSCLISRESGGDSGLRRALLEVIANGFIETVQDASTYLSSTFLAFTLSSADNSHSPSTTSKSRRRSLRLSQCPSTADTSVGPQVFGVLQSCLTYLVEHELVRIDGTACPNPQCSHCTQSSATDDHPTADSLPHCARVFPTPLGRAVLSSSLGPGQGLLVFEELDKARRSIALDTELHLVYLLTPIYLDVGAGLDWFRFLEQYQSLSVADRRVADLIGIEERFITRCAAGASTTNQHRTHGSLTEKLALHRRFYTALALYRLVSEDGLAAVSEHFGVNKGLLQSLQQQAATYAGMVTTFCNRLGWTHMERLLAGFQMRLFHGIAEELIDLVRLLPLVNAQRARALHAAGYTSVSALANSTPRDLVRVLQKAVPFQRGESVSSVDSRRTILLDNGTYVNEEEAAPLIIEKAKELLHYDLTATYGTNVVVLPEQSESDDQFSEQTTRPSSTVPDELTLKELPPRSLKRRPAESDDETDSKRPRSSSRAASSSPLPHKPSPGPSSSPSSIKDNESTPSPLMLNVSTESLQSPKSGVNLNKLKREDSKDESLPKLNTSTPGSPVVHRIPRPTLGNLFDPAVEKETDFSRSSHEQNFQRAVDPNGREKLLPDQDFSQSVIVPCPLSVPKPQPPISPPNFHSETDESLLITTQLAAIVDGACADASISKLDNSSPAVQTGRTSPPSQSVDMNDTLTLSMVETAFDTERLLHQVPMTTVEEVEPIVDLLPSDLNRRSINDLFSNSPPQISPTRSNPPSQSLDIASESQLISPSVSFLESVSSSNSNNLFNVVDVAKTDALWTTFIDEFSSWIGRFSQCSTQLSSLAIQPCWVLLPEDGFAHNRFPVVWRSGPAGRVSVGGSVDSGTSRHPLCLGLVGLLVSSALLHSGTVFWINLESTPINRETSIKKHLRDLERILNDLPKASLSLVVWDAKWWFRLTRSLFGGELACSVIDPATIGWLRDPDSGRPTLLSEVLRLKPGLENVLNQFSRLDKYEEPPSQFSDWSNISSYTSTENTKSGCPPSRTAQLFRLSTLPDHVSLAALQCYLLSHWTDPDLFCITELPKVLVQLETPCQLLLARMESAGFLLDASILRQCEKDLIHHSDLLEKVAHRLAGRPFRLECPSEVSTALFVWLRLPQLTEASDQSKAKKRNQLAILTGRRIQHKFPRVTNSVLSRMTGLHPLPAVVIEWRRIHGLVEKTFSNLVACCQLQNHARSSSEQMSESQPRHLSPTYDVYTATGRIVSCLPNIQALPNDIVIDYSHILTRPPAIDPSEKNEDKGKASATWPKPIAEVLKELPPDPIVLKPRTAFCTAPENLLISADFCQLELRLLAHLSNDKHLLELIGLTGTDDVSSILPPPPEADAFRKLAAHWLRLPSAESVSSAQRQQAKQLCYGLIYGMGAPGLAAQLEISLSSAESLMDSFLRAYPGVQQFINEAKQTAHRDGYVSTLGGRIRLLPCLKRIDADGEELDIRKNLGVPLVRSRGAEIKQHFAVAKAERQAVNTIIQGSAAEVAKMAMILVDERIQHLGWQSRCRLVLHEHDELLYEVSPSSLAPEIGSMIRRTMAAAGHEFNLRIPLPVKLRVGPNWSELQEVSWV